MFGDDDFGESSGVYLRRVATVPLFFRHVLIVAVDKHHHVCVLLDGSGFTKVGESRLVSFALLDGSA